MQRTLDLQAPPYAEGWRWRRAAPLPGREVSDVAVHPLDPARVAAVTPQGQVYLSRDGGRSWELVLGAASEGDDDAPSDEDVLLNVQARVDEIVSDSDNTSFDELDEDEAGDALDAVESDAGAQVLADVEVDPDFTVPGLLQKGEGATRVVWLGDDLFVAVDQELRWSPNDGRSWGSALDLPTWDVHGIASIYVALTDDGARIALEPRAWFDVDDGTEGIALTEGRIVGEVLLAATADGLWGTRDGQGWRRWGALQGPVLALASHPERPERVWALTPQGVRLSDDRGVTFGPPVLSGQGLVHIASPLPDRLVVVRRGSVLETRDDGRTWQPMTSGLEGITGGRLTPTGDGGLLLAAPDGVWVLRRLDLGAGSESLAFLDLTALMDATQTRAGLNETFDAWRRRWSAAAVPSLRIEGVWGPGQSEDWIRSGTRARTENDYGIVARLTWEPRRSRQTFSQFLVDDGLDVQVLMVDDTPYVLTGTDDYVVGSAVSRAGTEYRNEVAALVADLYRARIELVAERARVRDDRLQRRVLHELSIAEVDARLDALTDGAVSRWSASNPSTAQEL